MVVSVCLSGQRGSETQRGTQTGRQAEVEGGERERARERERERERMRKSDTRSHPPQHTHHPPKTTHQTCLVVSLLLCSWFPSTGGWAAQLAGRVSGWSCVCGVWTLPQHTHHPSKTTYQTCLVVSLLLCSWFSLCLYLGSLCLPGCLSVCLPVSSFAFLWWVGAHLGGWVSGWVCVCGCMGEWVCGRVVHPARQPASHAASNNPATKEREREREREREGKSERERERDHIAPTTRHPPHRPQTTHQTCLVVSPLLCSWLSLCLYLGSLCLPEWTERQ